MQKAFEIVQGFLNNGFEEVEGECETHGKSRRLVRAGKSWDCDKCLEATIKAETHAQWVERRQRDILEVAHLPAKYAGRRWPAVTPEQTAVRGLVRQFRDFIVANKDEWAALVFTGETGTGKTWLACELAEALARNLCMSVRYVMAQDMIAEIQAAYSVEGKTEAGEIERFAHCDLLVIDEADVKRDSANAALLFTTVINRRYMAGKPVVLITNQAMNNLEQYVGDRVYSRLHENSFVAAFTWPDFRRAVA